MNTKLGSINHKAEIKKLWLKNFPSLKSYGVNKLYKIVGPFIVGIELINLPRVKEYRPHFVLYPLYGNINGKSLKDCLSYPPILFEFYDKKKLQYNIPIDLKNRLNKDVINRVSRLKILVSQRNIGLFTILDFLRNQLTTFIVQARHSQPEIYKLMIYACLNAGNNKEKVKILNEISKEYENWNKEYFFKDYGNFNDWINRLKNITIIDLNNIINNNKDNVKLRKLLSFEIENKKPSMFRQLFKTASNTV